jgi:ABC-2 type transport system permease protein/bacitracin transport system permease protein
MFLVWIVILTVVTSISTLIFAFAAGLEGLSVNLFAGIFAQLPYANFVSNTIILLPHVKHNMSPII